MPIPPHVAVSESKRTQLQMMMTIKEIEPLNETGWRVGWKPTFSHSISKTHVGFEFLQRGSNKKNLNEKNGDQSIRSLSIKSKRKPTQFIH